nr:hypothetical protein [uncultured bacterium]
MFDALTEYGGDPMARKKDENDEIGLIRRADSTAPSTTDKERTRQLLDSGGAEVLIKANEVSESMFRGVLATHTGTWLSGEILQRDVQTKRKEMDYDSANLLVKMLIDRVIVCHLRLSIYEVFHAQKFKESMTFKAGMYWDKLLTNYQRRFHQACEALATARKLYAESELIESKVKAARSRGTLNSLTILERMKS